MSAKVKKPKFIQITSNYNVNTEDNHICLFALDTNGDIWCYSGNINGWIKFNMDRKK